MSNRVSSIVLPDTSADPLHGLDSYTTVTITGVSMTGRRRPVSIRVRDPIGQRLTEAASPRVPQSPRGARATKVAVVSRHLISVSLTLLIARAFYRVVVTLTTRLADFVMSRYTNSEN